MFINFNEGHPDIYIYIKKKIMTNFICWNCRGFKDKQDDIKHMISNHRPACFALQETYLKKEKTRSQFMVTIVLERIFIFLSGPLGGVALLTSNNFPHIQIPLNTNI